FVRLEVDAAPLEREPTRRIPLDDGADLEDACSGGELGGLEEAPAEARFEHDAPRALSGDAEAPATAPPEIDLVREDVEGVVDGNRHVKPSQPPSRPPWRSSPPSLRRSTRDAHRRSLGRIAHRGAHRRPRFAEA